MLSTSWIIFKLTGLHYLHFQILTNTFSFFSYSSFKDNLITIALSPSHHNTQHVSAPLCPSWFVCVFVFTAQEEDFRCYCASLFAVPVSGGEPRAQITAPEPCLVIQFLDEVRTTEAFWFEQQSFTYMKMQSESRQTNQGVVTTSSHKRPHRKQHILCFLLPLTVSFTWFFFSSYRQKETWMESLLNRGRATNQSKNQCNKN